MVRKAVFEKHAVSPASYEKLQASHQQLQTELAVAKETQAGLKNAIQASQEELANARAQYISIQIAHARTSAEQESSTRKVEELQDVIAGTKQRYAQLEATLQATERKVALLEAEVATKQEKLTTQKQDLEEIKAKLESEFKLLAADILDAKARSFGEQQEQKLTTLLDPFKEQIAVFKKEFEEKFILETKDKTSLRTEIAQLMQLNQSISKEANALTEALRGSTKKQGDWGEDILERILEFSGLQKNIHYITQAHQHNDEGQAIRPDVIVNYPDQRFLVIDSKVSLNSYWDFCNAPDTLAQDACLPLMINSLKAHINGLHGKAYTDVANSPDFIIMFVPVEAAYITAMQHDHTLWQYAYSRKVLLISPTNLIPAMKMISDMWQRDAISKDAEAIADKAVKLYEKLAGFVENFDAVGGELMQAHAKWETARKQLHTGRGNVLAQGYQLKQLLGKKTSKELPRAITEAALLEHNTTLAEDMGQ